MLDGNEGHWWGAGEEKDGEGTVIGGQRNAKTPLSLVYDDKSVLEQMSYSLIMQIMRHKARSHAHSSSLWHRVHQWNALHSRPGRTSLSGRYALPSSKQSQQKTPSKSPARLSPNDFLTAFPPALPPSFRLPEDPLFPPFYHPHHRFPSVAPSSSSGSTSQYETCESSLPSPNFSPALEPLPAPAPLTSAGSPPRLELQTSSGPHSRAPSVASTVPSTAASVSSVFSLTNEATAAICAAYKASVRKKKSFHRALWNPPPASFTPVPSPLAHNHTHHPLAHSHTPGSPVVGSGGDSLVSMSAGSPRTGLLTPSPLTPDGDPGTYKKMKELESQMEVLDQFVEVLMKLRSDLDCSAVSEVMESIKRKVKEENLADPPEPTIMKKTSIQGALSRFVVRS